MALELKESIRPGMNSKVVALYLYDSTVELLKYKRFVPDRFRSGKTKKATM